MHQHGQCVQQRHSRCSCEEMKTSWWIKFMHRIKSYFYKSSHSTAWCYHWRAGQWICQHLAGSSISHCNSSQMRHTWRLLFHMLSCSLRLSHRRQWLDHSRTGSSCWWDPATHSHHHQPQLSQLWIRQIQPLPQLLGVNALKFIPILLWHRLTKNQNLTFNVFGTFQ